MTRFIISLAASGASIALTISTVAAASPAVAQAVSPTLQAFVQIADLNLKSDAGRDTAERRIRTAVDRVCGGDQRLPAVAHCRADASRSAMQALQQHIGML